MKENFQHCIKCTLCEEHCPVYLVDPGFPGPKQAGPDAERFRMDNHMPVDEWVRKCAQCRRCDVACPHDVNPSHFIFQAIVRYASAHGKGLAPSIFAANFYLGRLGSFFAPITNFVSGNKQMKKMFRLLGISTYLPFPRFYFQTLSRNRKRKGSGKGKPKVVFFHGCFLDNNAPGVGRSIINVLAGLGIRVVVPAQVCCGLPALANGDLNGAKRFAHKNISTLSEYIDNGYDVIYSCPSCGNTLTQDYPEILDASHGKKIARNTYDVYEYLLMLMKTGELNPFFSPVHKRVAYHIPCHLRAMGIGYPAAKLLGMIPGLTIRIHDDHCCGLSGSYGFKAKFEETAMKLGTIAADAILETAPDILISDCGTCRIQMSHFTKLDAVDPIQVLSLSLNPGHNK